MKCGLLKPTSGSAQVMGIDLKTSAPQARQQLGYMAQKFSLYGQLTVRQNLEFFAGIYGLRDQQRQHKIVQMLDVFGLEPLQQQLLSQQKAFQQQLKRTTAAVPG